MNYLEEINLKNETTKTLLNLKIYGTFFFFLNKGHVKDFCFFPKYTSPTLTSFSFTRLLNAFCVLALGIDKMDTLAVLKGCIVQHRQTCKNKVTVKVYTVVSVSGCVFLFLSLQPVFLPLQTLAFLIVNRFTWTPN